ncbi:carbohydrate kinase family protein [Sporosarcina sp. JAI121]|uniref:carbohydrate kinase family protein n=1 Tax=Sporosarcina sp. JAI121 TaxID=2723064 RepID=UPI0015C7D7DA|nr:carbohydrate kinase [Sporosarcina sp. JAI121]NYF23205.1 fructokinase [Sporosarcina sp. JAI121]
MIDSKKKHVLIYGDAFVDYIAEDQSNTAYTTFLGGATVNVAAGISRLGAPSAFITVTGNDATSEFVRDELRKEGVDLKFAKLENGKRVSGVYIHLTEDNDRIFQTYIDETPDIQVEASDLSVEAFQHASVLHICSGTMFHPTALKTTREAVRLATVSGALLSIDANIRPLRWDSEELCRKTIMSFVEEADLLKLTEEEFFFLTETDTLEDGIAKLTPYRIPVVLVTAGELGTFAVIEGNTTHVGVEPVVPVDTTGAGDAFIAGILRQIHLKGQPETRNEWIDYISFGNKLGALCATKPGALSAMPRLEEIEE